MRWITKFRILQKSIQHRLQCFSISSCLNRLKIWHLQASPRVNCGFLNCGLSQGRSDERAALLSHQTREKFSSSLSSESVCHVKFQVGSNTSSHNILTACLILCSSPTVLRKVLHIEAINVKAQSLFILLQSRMLFTSLISGTDVVADQQSLTHEWPLNNKGCQGQS